MNRAFAVLLAIAISVVFTACDSQKSLTQTTPTSSPSDSAKRTAPTKAVYSSTESAPAATVGGTPVIASAAPIYDFGTIDNEGKVLHDFTITNQGTALLEIKDVKTSCGCTVAELNDKLLDPGESTDISATFSLAGKKGLQSKFITITSNDPATPSYKLQIKGTAVPAILHEPRTIQFGRMFNDEEKTQILKLTAMRDDLSFKIASIDTTLPAIKTNIKEIEAGKAYEITVSTTDALLEGNFTESLTIKTDAPGRAPIVVAVTGQVIGDIGVSPTQVTIAYSSNPEDFSNYNLRVTPGRIKEFNILEVVPPNDRMEIELVPQGQAGFIVKIAKLTRNGELDGKEIIIRTDIPEKPEIRIPIRNVKPRARTAPKRLIPANLRNTSTTGIVQK